MYVFKTNQNNKSYQLYSVEDDIIDYGRGKSVETYISDYKGTAPQQLTKSQDAAILLSENDISEGFVIFILEPIDFKKGYKLKYGNDEYIIVNRPDPFNNLGHVRLITKKV